jgi:kynurenine formamidase
LSTHHYVKEIIDLSMPLKSMDTPVYPGYPQPLRATFTTLNEHGYGSHIWTFAEHTSTHVDAPVHMVEGATTVDKMPLSHYVGDGVVLDFSKKPPLYDIGKKDIADALSAAGYTEPNGTGRILLFYTGYSTKDRSADWLKNPGLNEEGARYIIQMKFNAVGFDAPSPDQPPFMAHKLLLPEGIVIFENLANLDRVLGKDFLFVGTPLALVGGTASPCRPVALVL